MANTKAKFYPFAYNMDENPRFNSLMTQRKAEFKIPAEEVYNNKKQEDDKLMWESFRENIEAPTPQIKEIDGYKSEEETKENANTETETPAQGEGQGE